MGDRVEEGREAFGHKPGQEKQFLGWHPTNCWERRCAEIQLMRKSVCVDEPEQVGRKQKHRRDVRILSDPRKHWHLTSWKSHYLTQHNEKRPARTNPGKMFDFLKLKWKHKAASTVGQGEHRTPKKRRKKQRLPSALPFPRVKWQTVTVWPVTGGKGRGGSAMSCRTSLTTHVSKLQTFSGRWGLRAHVSALFFQPREKGL